MKAAKGATTRRLASWIDGYLEYTQHMPGPEIFRLWSGIATVGAALERRTFVTTSDLVLYPNLFVLLVARPGIGKSVAMNPATALLKKAEVFHVMPKDVNRATFLRWLGSEEVRDRDVQGDSILEEYHSAIAHLSEFGVFVRAHELDLLSMLCDIFDCPPDYENRRIYQGKDNVFIPNPQVSILAGTQPGYLASVFPPEAWSQGFMGRVIMVHVGTPTRKDLFATKKKDTKLESALISDLLAMKQMRGEFEFTDEAKDALRAWYGPNGECDAGGLRPPPSYPRLESYNVRRILHMLKLVQCSAAARSSKLEIDIDDFDLALDWMLTAEKTMPDVFLEMAGKSDNDTLRELWHYGWTAWIKNQQPIHQARLFSFLSVRVPAYAADKILELAVSSGYFRKLPGSLYQPRPKNEWGQM